MRKKGGRKGVRTVPYIQGSALQSGFLSKSDSIVGMEGRNPPILCVCYAFAYASVTNVRFW